MAGFALSTNAPPLHVRDTAVNCAASMGFAVVPETDWAFRASKGSTLAGALLGAFIPVCRFRLSVTSSPDGMTHLQVERNSPWWTGAVGIRRVKNRARDLTTAIGSALSSQGAMVQPPREF
jgi:hypothetical protein